MVYATLHRANTINSESVQELPLHGISGTHIILLLATHGRDSVELVYQSTHCVAEQWSVKIWIDERDARCQVNDNAESANSLAKSERSQVRNETKVFDALQIFRLDRDASGWIRWIDTIRFDSVRMIRRSAGMRHAALHLHSALCWQSTNH